MKTIGIFSSDSVACAKATAKSLSKQAVGGFDGFFNDATVTITPASFGSWAVSVSGGCREFHRHAKSIFDGGCVKVFCH